MQFVLIARPAIGRTLFTHWLADAGEAAAAAQTIAQVEGRPCEVHALHADRVLRVDVHQPDGSVTRPAMYREPGATLITGIVL